MRKINMFQEFQTQKFLNGKKFLISNMPVVDEEKGRLKLQVVITEDKTNYGSVEEPSYTSDNLFEKIYVSIYSPNFRNLNFKQMDPFDFNLLTDLKTSVFGEVYDRKISISGNLKQNNKLPNLKENK